MIPMKKTPLSQLATVSAGQAAPKDDEFSDHGISFVRAGSLDSLLSGKSESDLELVRDETAKLRKLKIYPKGTVLFAKSGMSATKDRIYVLQNPAYVVSHLATLIPNDNAHADYLRLALKRFPPSVLIKDPAYPAISLGDIQSYEIPVPEQFDDQIRIANLLGKVEWLISQRKENLQQLDELLKSVFLEMFGDPVRNEKGWNTLSFPEIGKFISGATPSKSRPDYWNGHFPWVSPKDMKVSIIRDSEDHISESAFTESTLKRISPNHLLIVVRGMILAHSFPVAINVVDISINQDMKAIKPIKDVNVVYLQNCLNALNRQILELISSAAHGTKKFDSIAMRKLFIPVPPATLQNQFTAIVKKVESLKLQYQRNLTGLEKLYGALSQKAFKGELDLSRVPHVPIANHENPVVDDKPLFEEKSAKEVEMFASLDKPAMATPEGRVRLLRQWFQDWLHNASPTATLSVPQFWQEAQLRALDYEGEDDENTDFTIVEYDQFKQWLFEAIEQGQILQAQNIVSEPGEELRFGNQIVLKKAQ